MNFCDSCESLLSYEYIIGGDMKFKCRSCAKILDVQPKDTLVYEKKFSQSATKAKDDILIKNSPYDLAGYKVERNCKTCLENKIESKIMTMIYTTDNKVMYTCECGAYEGT